MPEQLTVAIAIPTRGRAHYLEHTLASVAPQAARAGAGLLVVCDGPDEASRQTALRHGAQVYVLPRQTGANAARNAAARQTDSDLLVLIDDDVEAPPDWLDALLDGVARAPDREVFGGPIRARLERGPRACGREPAPITTLDCGPADRDVPYVWSANLAIRRSALGRVGPFDERIRGRGEEEEWLERYQARGGRIRYLGQAELIHRRDRADSRLRALARADYHLGRSARRNDVRKRRFVPLRRELLTLLACLAHAARRGCAVGLIRAAHSAGRVRQAIAEISHPEAPDAEDFLSGTSGGVQGVTRTARAVLLDGRDDTIAAATLQGTRIDRAARRGRTGRRVLALAIERPEVPNLLAAARTELEQSRHQLTLLTAPVGGAGKFENLNRLLGQVQPGIYDWLLVIDDDVALPRRFLDRFLFLAERFDLRLAQPAHRHRSHAAWAVTRRQPASLVRETRFVEIGPVTAFHASTFETLLPFPELRVGWGLDLHWAAVAQRRGWRIGVVDATPIGHGLRPVAAAYDSAGAMAEARELLAGRPYVRAADAQRTLLTHRRL